MAIFADVAGRVKMNSLRMARPSRHESVYIRKVRATVKKVKQQYDVQSIQSQRAQSVAPYAHENFRLSQYDRGARKLSIAQRLKEWNTRRLATAAANKEAMAIQLESGFQQFGSDYASRMVGFNTLPGIVQGLTNRPLQTMVNYGSPGLQKLILQTLGPKLGAGAARLVDTALMGGAGNIPALNIGAGLMFETAPPGSVNIPENRLQYSFDTQQPFSNFFSAQDAAWQYSKQPGWTIGK